MKELSVEEKAQAYDEALKWMENIYPTLSHEQQMEAEVFFPIFKESEDEKIKNEIINFIKDNTLTYTNRGSEIQMKWIAWLEKQDSHYTFEIKKGYWYKCVCDYMLNGSDLIFKNDRLYYCRSDWRLRGEIDERNVKDIGVNGYKSFFRPATNQEIKDWLEKQGKKDMIPLDKVIKFLDDQLVNDKDKVTGESFINFRNYGAFKETFISYFKRKMLKKQDEQKPTDVRTIDYWRVEDVEQKPIDKVEPKFKVGDTIRLKNGDGLEWTVEKVLNNGYYIIVCADRDDFTQLDDNWELVKQKPAKVEPKFKVKYAGSEYNVLEVKDIAGVAYYGIEDEPNHIDYVLPDNCEIVSEQKPVDKIEPKFKVGDWIVYYRNDSSREILYVYDIRDGRYYFNDNIHFSWSIKECDEKSHLWTIQDAKDGDVLIDTCNNYKNPLIFILKKFETVDFGLAQKSDYSSYCFLSMSDKPRFKEGHFHHMNDIKPATKEQRDTLIKAMTDAGYRWNKKERKLEKIEQNPWSEEDETTKNNISHIIKQYDKISKKENQPCWYVGDCLLWMQNIKDRVQPKPKQEWSEEDIMRIDNLIAIIENRGYPDYVSWLKSLKDKMQPWSHWKPSDEQMEALDRAQAELCNTEYNKPICDLIDSLKKLKG